MTIDDPLPTTSFELEALHTKSAIQTLDDQKTHEAGCKDCKWVGGVFLKELGRMTMQTFRSCREYRRIKQDGWRRTDRIMKAIEKLSRAKTV